MINKTESRKKAISQRALAFQIEKCREITERVKQSQVFRNAKTVFLYVSTGSEPETRELIKACLMSGKRVFVPFISGPGEMEAVEIDSLDALVPGFMGIDAPKDATRRVDPDKIDLAITPGLLFSERGDRLGYGGGFYDRFFERMRKDSLRAALLFEESLGEVPKEDHDQRVDLLFTPCRTIETEAYEERNSSVGAFIASKGKFGMRLGLETIEALLDKLGHPEAGLPFVHIAGTNGKGSMTALLSSIAEEAGYTTGTFTSPALERFNERIQVGREPISDATIDRLYQKIRAAIRQMTKEGLPEPTGFEIETALAYLYFKERGVDLVCMEVGLGGRLDATNSVKDPLICIIGSISLEHTQYLGNTVEEIASEKAGILKKGASAIFYPQEDSILSVLQKKAQEVGLRDSRIAKRDTLTYLSSNSEGQKLLYKKDGTEPLVLTLALQGSHQILNAATVLSAVDALRERGFFISSDALVRGFLNVRHPGRMETLSTDPHLLIDGAHNEDGIRALVKNLKKDYADRPIDLYFGMLEDKNIDQVFDDLLSLSDRIFPMTPDSPNALSSQQMKERIETYAREVDGIFDSPREAVIHALKQKGRYSIFTGSLYLIGQIRRTYHEQMRGQESINI